MIKLSFNTQVKVKLNEYGRHIYFHRYDRIPQAEKIYVKTDNDGFSTFTLWEFMNIYGKYIHMVNPPICKDIYFYIEEEEIKKVEEV